MQKQFSQCHSPHDTRYTTSIPTSIIIAIAIIVIVRSPLYFRLPESEMVFYENLYAKNE